MPLLKAQHTKVVYHRARVDVPEFGTDEHGEPYYVFVRNLSIAEQKEVVRRATWIDQASRRILFDYPQVAALAAVSGKETDTDRGVRVFPSEVYLTDLTMDFEPAIKRIALEILALSGLITPQVILPDGSLTAAPTADRDETKNA